MLDWIASYFGWIRGPKDVSLTREALLPHGATSDEAVVDWGTVRREGETKMADGTLVPYEAVIYRVIDRGIGIEPVLLRVINGTHYAERAYPSLAQARAVMLGMQRRASIKFPEDDVERPF